MFPGCPFPIPPAWKALGLVPLVLLLSINDSAPCPPVLPRSPLVLRSAFAFLLCFALSLLSYSQPSFCALFPLCLPSFCALVSLFPVLSLISGLNPFGANVIVTRRRLG